MYKLFWTAARSKRSNDAMPSWTWREYLADDECLLRSNAACFDLPEHKRDRDARGHLIAADAGGDRDDTRNGADIRTRISNLVKNANDTEAVSRLLRKGAKGHPESDDLQYASVVAAGAIHDIHFDPAGRPPSEPFWIVHGRGPVAFFVYNCMSLPDCAVHTSPHLGTRSKLDAKRQVSLCI